MITAKNIIFDLGGVLVDLNMSGMHQACAQLGIDPGLLFVKSTDNKAATVCQGMSASKVISDYQVGKMTTEEFVNVVMRLCKPGTTPEEVINAWNSCLGEVPTERIMLIKKLREMGHRTFLLSNTNDLHWEYTKQKCFNKEGMTADDLFDIAFVSHEVRLAKPDGEIYRHVIQEIGDDASDCLFIDDALINVEAAKREGMQAEWLDLSKEDTVTLFNRL